MLAALRTLCSNVDVEQCFCNDDCRFVDRMIDATATPWVCTKGLPDVRIAMPVHFFDFSLTQHDSGLTLSDMNALEVTIVVLPLCCVLQVVYHGKC